jgi:hypothetical protein
MKIWNLTGDRIIELEQKVKSLVEQKVELQETTNIVLYAKELEQI